MSRRGISPENLRVLGVAKRWPHHTPSGGYGRLGGALGTLTVERRPRPRFLVPVDRLWRRYCETRHILLDYRFDDLMAEIEVIVRSNWQRPDVVHVLYAEEQLDILLRARSLLPCPLVTTFHFSADVARQRFERLHRTDKPSLDGAIVLATSELDGFRRWLGPEKVTFIPHGIDTEAFRPAAMRRTAPLQLLIVGDHRRDVDAMLTVARRCLREAPDISFTIVAPPGSYAAFTSLGNCRLLSGISEAELRSLYQIADALFLPLVFATANNAILEAMACGTPVISTESGGIPDYVDAHSGWLIQPGDVDGLFEIVRELSLRPEAAWAKREAARRRAELFSWDKIASLCRAAYLNLLATGAMKAEPTTAFALSPHHA